MPDAVVLVLLAACGTALATGLGAIPVFFLGDRAAQLTPLLLGFAAGVMGVASIAGLLVPATEEGSALAVVAGLSLGVGLLGCGPRRSLDATFLGRADPAHAPRRSSSSSSSSTASPRASRSAPPSPPTAPASASS